MTPKSFIGSECEALPAGSIADEELVESFLKILRYESDAIQTVRNRLINDRASIECAAKVVAACRASRGTRSRVIACGIGKAGLIARKVSATLSSTGTPSYVLHPSEALHGDLGAVQPGDAGLFFSYSGETIDVVRVAMEMRRMDCSLVAITRSRGTALGRVSQAVLELGQLVEACELGLAPSSSTTAMLAVGDALALSIARATAFSAKEFATNHPGGMLGLAFRPVTELMRTGSRLVCVDPLTSIRTVVERVSNAHTGAAVLTDVSGKLIGIFTDGDLRRALLNGGDVLTHPVSKYASIPCTQIGSTSSLADTVMLMRERGAKEIPIVLPETQKVVGMICAKDIQW